MYLLFNSVAGPLRKNYTDIFLTTYYSTFNNVLAGVDKKPTHTFEQLQSEYLDKHDFGMMMALMAIPIMLADPANAPDFATVEENKLEEFMNDQRERGKKQMKEDPALRPRYLDLIDELVEKKIIRKR